MDLTQIQHFCAYQERCHSEVRSRLLHLGFSGDDVEEAIAALVADDFLNEERYAKAYCGGKFRVKQWGRNKIRQSLQWKQVSDYCIRKGMDEIPEEDYHRTLQELALKKWQELNVENNIWIRKQKVQRYLVQKGYETELVRNSCQDLE